MSLCWWYSNRTETLCYILVKFSVFTAEYLSCSCVCVGGCVCVWPRLATDQDPSWKHVEREESLVMLRCSQQVLSTLLQVPRPLNPPSLCFFPSSPQGLFPLFSFFLDPSSFVHLIPNLKGKHLMEPPLAVSLIATHTNTHTRPHVYRRESFSSLCALPASPKGLS